MLQILYQDDDCVAVNKPAGMLVHRSWLAKHETQFVMQGLRDRLGQHVFPVHRLDRPTSGVLLFALSSIAARQLSEQFANHTVSKQYLAVVRGWVCHKVNGVCDRGSPMTGRIDYALKPRLDKIADKFANKDKPAETAITDFSCMATAELPFVVCERYATSRYSLIKLVPHTGRKHQLRRHMTHLFHPIIGDTTHGDTAQNKAVLAHTGVGRLLLHASQLDFNHLQTGERIQVIAPLDDDFARVMQAFGWGECLG
ncbi:MAG: tRNA pseudouridine(65) synthase TruC [Moraxella sp.]|nr:tRNA pseudouridine(65) synthase TruC [Moraxella sp.]